MFKLISLNIEGDNHYDKIFPFFQKENPDIACLMEVYEIDLPMISEKLGMEYRFVSLQRITTSNPFRQATKGSQGIAIFSKLPFVNEGKETYESVPADTNLTGAEPEACSRKLLWVDIQHENTTYKFVTTHFTWSPNGSVTDLQRADVDNLLMKLVPLKEFVLCGDFNAPRGKEIFARLAHEYADNIPPEVVTTLDRSIHRAGDKLPDLVVDGLFSTPEYVVSNVRVVPGVSDHCALVGEITKR